METNSKLQVEKGKLPDKCHTGEKFKPNLKNNRADDLEKFMNLENIHSRNNTASTAKDSCRNTSALMEKWESGMFSNLVDDLVEEYLNESDCGMDSEQEDNLELDEDSQSEDDSVSDSDSESNNVSETDDDSEYEDNSGKCTLKVDIQDGQECALETSSRHTPTEFKNCETLPDSHYDSVEYLNESNCGIDLENQENTAKLIKLNIELQEGEESIISFQDSSTEHVACDSFNDEDHHDHYEIQYNVDQNEKIEIDGRRIIDIQHFFEQIKELNSHSSHYDCSYSNMSCIKETKQGLKSIFWFRCDVCQIQKAVYSYDRSNSYNMLDINYAAVLGAYAVGLGRSQSEELLGNMEVPYMAKNTYDKYQRNLQKDLKFVAEKQMKIAVNEEKKLAIERKQVDYNGVPLLTVGGDACWDKRSYGTNYNASSGAASLVGELSKKVIWYGVKSRKCKKCYYVGENEEHDCNINFVGPPTGMESQLLLEAFMESEEKYGVRYYRLIADGDSKAYKAISDARVYQNPYLQVEKIDCSLHLKRAARGRLRKIKTLSRSKAESIIKGIKCSRNYWVEQDMSFADKISNFRKDILNAPYHVFGQHEKCHIHFCDKEKHKNDINYVPQMEKSGEMNRIQTATSRMLDNARSLLYNKNTNPVEQFNAIVAKHLGAKRVSFATAKSHAGRVAASVIDYNTHRLGSEIVIYKLGWCSDTKLIYQIESKRIAENKAPRKTPRKYNRINSGPDNSYGTNTCDTIDKDPEAYEMKKSVTLAELRSRQSDREQIQIDTIDQHNSNLWKQYRKHMITASKFGSICRVRSTSTYPKIILSMLYPPDSKSKKEVRHQIDNEDNAINKLQAVLGVTIKKCGLFIDNKHCFLGASPSGLLGNDGLVEIKCPFDAKDCTIDEAILDRRITFWNVSRRQKNDKNFTPKITGVNKNHPYYFQVQGQLHVTQRKYCWFTMWSYNDIKRERIERDDEFWNNHMEKKLEHFWINGLLPEIADPRHTRQMPIRF